MSYQLEGLSGSPYREVTFERIFFSLKCKSVGAAECWLTSGGVHLNLPGAQLDDSLLRFLKNFYLREQLMVHLCYSLTLAFCGIAMDGD